MNENFILHPAVYLPHCIACRTAKLIVFIVVYNEIFPEKIVLFFTLEAYCYECALRTAVEQ
ncbi:hypothetical protein CI793_12285 [Anoxybacillus ayderensis]|nr:hypothetical protein B379_12530 [Anoxybacillus ayderensis G10]THD15570.1 hypothetical protein CI793_12285 [Anoxybacillus ayderensis]